MLAPIMPNGPDKPSYDGVGREVMIANNLQGYALKIQLRYLWREFNANNLCIYY